MECILLILLIVFGLKIQRSLSAVGAKDVPLSLRIIAALILVAFFGVLIFIIIYICKYKSNLILPIVGGIILFLLGMYVESD